MQNPNAGSLAAAYLHWGQEVPDGLIAPELHDVERDLFEAFWELSTDRQIGMAPGQIPAASIEREAASWRFLGPGVFRRLMRAMDSAYLAVREEVQAEKRPKK